MPTNPIWLSHFWQELLRICTGRDLSVEVGVGFVILEPTDMNIEPCELTRWTFKLVKVALSIGFFIATILYLISDLHPADGMEKAVIADQVLDKIESKSSGCLRIDSYVSFFMIVELMVWKNCNILLMAQCFTAPITCSKLSN